MKEVLGVDEDVRGVLDGLRVVDDGGDLVGLAVVLPSLSPIELHFQLPRSIADLCDFRCHYQVFVVSML